MLRPRRFSRAGGGGKHASGSSRSRRTSRRCSRDYRSARRPAPARRSGGDQPLEQHDALARHARTRHDEVEAGREGGFADRGLDVGVEAQVGSAERPTPRRRRLRRSGQRSAHRSDRTPWARPAGRHRPVSARVQPVGTSPRASNRTAGPARARRPSLRADAAELLADRLRPAPHRDDLDAAARDLAQRELAGDRRRRRAASAPRAPPTPPPRGRSGARRGSASASRGCEYGCALHVTR